MKIFRPDMLRDGLCAVTPDDIRALGAKVIAIDADNTSSFDGTTIPLDGSGEWIENMQKEGFPVYLVSNAKTERAKVLSDGYGIPVVGFAMKPMPFGYLRVAMAEKVGRKDVLMIGDQLFTDILGANIAGAKSIYVRPYEKERRAVVSYTIKRSLESFYFMMLRLVGKEI